jgi:hypothetical protein
VCFFSYVISYVNNIKMIKKMRFSYVNLPIDKNDRDSLLNIIQSVTDSNEDDELNIIQSVPDSNEDDEFYSVLSEDMFSVISAKTAPFSVSGASATTASQRVIASSEGGERDEASGNSTSIGIPGVNSQVVSSSPETYVSPYLHMKIAFFKSFLYYLHMKLHNTKDSIVVKEGLRSALSLHPTADDISNIDAIIAGTGNYEDASDRHRLLPDKDQQQTKPIQVIPYSNAYWENVIKVKKVNIECFLSLIDGANNVNIQREGETALNSEGFSRDMNRYTFFPHVSSSPDVFRRAICEAPREGLDMKKYRTRILHLVGHGSENGDFLWVSELSGRAVALDYETFKGCLEQDCNKYSENGPCIDFIFLNACGLTRLARDINSDFPHISVFAWHGNVGSEDARLFSQAFYACLDNDKDSNLGEAFIRAKVRLRVMPDMNLEKLKEYGPLLLFSQQSRLEPEDPYGVLKMPMRAGNASVSAGRAKRVNDALDSESDDGYRTWRRPNPTAMDPAVGALFSYDPSHGEKAGAEERDLLRHLGFDVDQIQPLGTRWKNDPLYKLDGDNFIGAATIAGVWLTQPHLAEAHANLPAHMQIHSWTHRAYNLLWGNPMRKEHDGSIHFEEGLICQVFKEKYLDDPAIADEVLACFETIESARMQDVLKACPHHGAIYPPLLTAVLNADFSINAVSRCPCRFCRQPDHPLGYSPSCTTGKANCFSRASHVHMLRLFSLCRQAIEAHIAPHLPL